MGEVARVCRAHGGRCPPGCVDFSSNLNPLAPPEEVVEALTECVEGGAAFRYPDYEYVGLREVLSGWYGVDADLIVPVNGAAEALSLLPVGLRVKALIALEPTFGDHECLARALGFELRRVLYRGLGGSGFVEPPDPQEVVSAARKARKPCAILASDPNNPTGAPLGMKWVEEVWEDLPEGTYLILDLAFKEFSAEGLSLKAFEGMEGVAAVVSLTKTLSIPGLRAGFVYGCRCVAEALNLVRQAWNVNSLADCLTRKVLAEFGGRVREFIEMSRDVLASERAWMRSKLLKAGLAVPESDAPYLLIHHPAETSVRVFKEMLRRGYCVRDASSFYGLSNYYTRVAVRLREDNEGLVRALTEVLGAG